jgi:hypothetical protein
MAISPALSRPSRRGAAEHSGRIRASKIRIKVLVAPLTGLRTKQAGETVVPLNGNRADNAAAKETNHGQSDRRRFMLEGGRPAHRWRS